VLVGVSLLLSSSSSIGSTGVMISVEKVSSAVKPPLVRKGSLVQRERLREKAKSLHGLPPRLYLDLSLPTHL